MERDVIWKPGRCLALGLVALVAVGCRPASEGAARHGTQDDHAHEHGDVDRTVQVTVFDDAHEVFLEHPLVVAATPTPFVVHLTELATREPRRAGPLRFAARQGQETSLDHVEPAPARAGIYEALLTFPQAGTWTMALTVPTDQGEQRIPLPDLRVHASTHDAQHAVVPEPPAGIAFLKEQQWRVQLGTEVVQPRRLVEHLRLPAQVAARPGGRAQVRTPLPGYLVLPPEAAMPLVGDVVAAGQVLARLQPALSELATRLIEAEGEVARTRLEREQAEVAFERIEKLAQADAKSPRELQEAAYALKAAEARHAAALALQRTYREADAGQDSAAGAAGLPAIELRSPVAGKIVAQSDAALGELIPAEQIVFTVLDATRVLVEAHVPEASLDRLGEAKAARYAVPGTPERLVPLTAEGGGRLVSAGMPIDPTTRTARLVYEVANTDNRLRVGQSLDLYVETVRVEEALAVPGEAIVEEGGRPIAFVQVGAETFDKRELRLGIRDGPWVQVLAGLAAGDRVVTHGAYAVRLASVAGALPAHGYAH
ncbi:MAG: efflux RND transporter periplasmic adaptor subunit [Verrucomicrobiales bacterium]|nr:efflux RND transporter periplasmic adaptor subunit [Verrucomicrobiales bacterium]